MKFDLRSARRSAGAMALTLILPIAAAAQFGSGMMMPDGRLAGGEEHRLKTPAPYQVFQRDASNRADIPLVLPDAYKDYEIVQAYLNGPSPGNRYRDGKFSDVPAGGPYQINLTIRPRPKPEPEPEPEPAKGDEAPPKGQVPSANKAMEKFMKSQRRGVRPPNFEGTVQLTAGPFFVGDLWILAGQSNMEGVGDLVDTTPPNERVALFGMDDKWSRAEEPLHWLVDSADPVHSGDPKTRPARSADAHKNRNKGAGLGLPFATVLAGMTNVPIGLIASAHGGTSMDQWDPAKKGEGGNSLYGSMMRQVGLAGGKVKGVLWYQGESDASVEASKAFPKKFAALIAAVRKDLGDPELPFYYVQIGRFVRAGSVDGWNAVQEAQRKAAEEIPNTAMISVIDLELDDLIHVGTQGLKRAGVRLARIASRELFGQVGGSTPTFDRVTKGTGNTLVVRFKGVNRPSQTGPTNPMNNGPLADIPALSTLGVPLSSRSTGFGGMSGMPAPATLGGLQPSRHIAGFSIRAEDGSEIPILYEAHVGANRESVVLKLSGPIPAKASLWYGHGLNPYCNLTDSLDMAVPVFGPIPLDSVK